ncbi:MAG: 3-dehydroquinate synthase family protein [Lepagella sp.]
MTQVLTAESLSEALQKLRTFSGNGQLLTVVDSRLSALGSQFSFSSQLSTLNCEGGEECKTPAHVERVWQWLGERGATRSSLVVALGGGSITDMAGFAAACFKRGVPTANIPTTLLGAVDAAIGGKTAINFAGIKNEIGAFHQPRAVVLVPELWRTLPYEQLASGYGEILKTALLQGPDQTRQALLAGQHLADGDQDPFPLELVLGCARFKQKIVGQDPHDQGLRRQLNLGHTFGHAIESYGNANGRPISHGHAVAIGLVAALALSTLKFSEARAVSSCNTRHSTLYSVVASVREVFPPYPLGCKDFDALVDLMAHDKKNAIAGHPLFVLLPAPGQPVLDVPASIADIRASLDITCDLLS